MARITTKEWNNYIAMLRRISDRASTEMLAEITSLKKRYDSGEINDKDFRARLIDYAYALATRYGEASGALACEMYEAIAALQGVTISAAIPAETATIAETAKAVNGTLKTGNPDIVSSAVGRLVKMAGVDTMQQNAIRDGAEWAWIPRGDTCAFCFVLASNGWQRATKKALKDGHAEHIHANCDCTYAVRFNDSLDVEGYDPQEYLDMYENVDGDTSKQRINSLRREFYAQNRDKINEQKRSAYEKRMERNSTAAEEVDV